MPERKILPLYTAREGCNWRLTPKLLELIRKDKLESIFAQHATEEIRKIIFEDKGDTKQILGLMRGIGIITGRDPLELFGSDDFATLFSNYSGSLEGALWE